MPNSQKKRNHVEMDGKASSTARALAQDTRAAVNAESRLLYVSRPDPYYLTPWQASKAKRLAERIAKGKTYTNWLKKSAKGKPVASVSNLSTTR